MLQVVIYGKIQFLKCDGGLEVVNNSTDIHKQSEATVETSIWGKIAVKEWMGEVEAY